MVAFVDLKSARTYVQNAVGYSENQQLKLIVCRDINFFKFN